MKIPDLRLKKNNEKIFQIEKNRSVVFLFCLEKHDSVHNSTVQSDITTQKIRTVKLKRSDFSTFTIGNPYSQNSHFSLVLVSSTPRPTVMAWEAGVLRC